MNENNEQIAPMELPEVVEPEKEVKIIDPEPPKKRGRPPKPKEKKPKRPRGRPRKYPKVEKIKRPRGRPRKIEVEDIPIKEKPKVSKPELVVQRDPTTGQFLKGNSGGPGRQQRTLSSHLKKLLKQTIEGKEGMTYVDAINKRLISEAIKGEHWAIRLIYEYVDGKPKDSIERAMAMKIGADLIKDNLSKGEVELLTRQAQELLEFHKRKEIVVNGNEGEEGEEGD